MDSFTLRVLWLYSTQATTALILMLQISNTSQTLLTMKPRLLESSDLNQDCSCQLSTPVIRGTDWHCLAALPMISFVTLSLSFIAKSTFGEPYVCQIKLEKVVAFVSKTILAITIDFKIKHKFCTTATRHDSLSLEVQFGVGLNWMKSSKPRRMIMRIMMIMMIAPRSNYTFVKLMNNDFCD